MSTDYEAVYADVMDVNVLKLKRRALRSTITHQEQYLTTLFKTPLQGIKTADITSMLNIKYLVNDHEALQNHIKDITTPGEEDVEFDNDSR